MREDTYTFPKRVWVPLPNGKWRTRERNRHDLNSRKACVAQLAKVDITKVYVDPHNPCKLSVYKD